MDLCNKDPLALHKYVALPFILEDEGQHAEAIKSYGKATQALVVLTTKHRHRMRKVLRKMFEHQAEVLGERKVYLEQLSKIGQLSDAVPAPTFLSISKELEDPQSLSSIHRSLSLQPMSANSNIDFTIAGAPAFPLSSTLPSNTTNVEYFIDSRSELVNLGESAVWFFVREANTKQVFWSAQVMVSYKVPRLEFVLQRPGEIMPGCGAIHVEIVQTAGGAFNLRMQSTLTGWVLEVPDRSKMRKDWSPRRFQYGGRQFVWKQEGCMWESMYETGRVWPVEGSKTGKKNDEIIGERLCWGEKSSRTSTEARIWFRAGLDQGFVEHCLASQLARYFKVLHPYSQSIERLQTAAGISSVLASVAAFTS